MYKVIMQIKWVQHDIDGFSYNTRTILALYIKHEYYMKKVPFMYIEITTTYDFRLTIILYSVYSLVINLLFALLVTHHTLVHVLVWSFNTKCMVIYWNGTLVKFVAIKYCCKVIQQNNRQIISISQLCR